ncbi:hypothetical protein CWE09_07370 [Aliidiomarina minuta]|uniref:Uncharacterized protein n=1 Tax=Aliidiomarina minuta TaxID=880057 RepID=A0A432WA87_9GAMM|nr:DsrE family protein [Aliidiomarina minuta]RUO26518.1 hypothetical protein CWE09_07370 [Aliidiomarina minuta]
MNIMQNFFAALSLSILTIGGAQASDKSVLVTLTAESTETQGMAMVLSNAMQSQGAEVHVLLCDQAGMLAIEGYSAEALAPRNVTPVTMLENLISGGATVQVCALFLPNRSQDEADLLDGVSVAQPPAIAEKLLNPDVRVFNF